METNPDLPNSAPIAQPLEQPLEQHKIDIKPRPSVPLVYTATNPLDTYTSCYLVDDSLISASIFMKDASDTCLAIQYNYGSSKKDLDELLKTLPNLTRMAIIFDTLDIDNKKFLDYNLFFTKEDTATPKPETYSPNCDYLIKLNIKKIDFLCCNTLLNSNYKKFYELFPYSVGASNDLTGNINAGGDWIMESTNEDIQKVYFNDNIKNYSETLVYTPPTPAVILSSCQTINSWPVLGLNTYAYLIQGSKPITIRLGPNINVADAGHYFVIGSDDITIIGHTNEIIISCFNYGGLVRNGNGVDYRGYNNITVKNITISKNSTGTLADYAGWIGGRYYGQNSKNSRFIKCVNNANMTNARSNFGIYGRGGIVGANAYECYAYKCYNTGNFNNIGNYNTGVYGNGGIFGGSPSVYILNGNGVNGGSSSINCIAEYCYNTGYFNCSSDYNGGVYGNGGIFGGAPSGYNNSTGNINSSIAGGNGGNSTANCVAKYCYNVGYFSCSGILNGGVYGNGGIFGGAPNGYISGNGSSSSSIIKSNGGNSATNCVAKYCYNTGYFSCSGNIAGGVYGNGGIFGGAPSGYSFGNGFNNSSIIGGNGGNSMSNCVAEYCYNTGYFIYSSIYQLGGVYGNGGIFGGAPSGYSYCGSSTSASIIGGNGGNSMLNCVAKYCYNTGYFSCSGDNNGGVYGNGGIFGGAPSGCSNSNGGTISSINGGNGGNSIINCVAEYCYNTGYFNCSGDYNGGAYGNGGIFGGAPSGYSYSYSNSNSSITGGNGGKSTTNCVSKYCYNISYFNNSGNNSGGVYGNCGILGGTSGGYQINVVITTFTYSNGTIGIGTNNTTAENCYNISTFTGTTLSNNYAIFPTVSTLCKAKNIYSTYYPLYDVSYTPANTETVTLTNCSVQSEATGTWSSDIAKKYLINCEHHWTNNMANNTTPWYLTDFNTIFYKLRHIKYYDKHHNIYYLPKHTKAITNPPTQYNYSILSVNNKNPTRYNLYIGSDGKLYNTKKYKDYLITILRSVVGSPNIYDINSVILV
jgi:hypothetical protein